MTLIGLLGVLDVKAIWGYFILFILNGLGQSAVFPCTVAIMANWFPP